jgi:hypothetical protein
MQVHRYSLVNISEVVLGLSRAQARPITWTQLTQWQLDILTNPYTIYGHSKWNNRYYWNQVMYLWKLYNFVFMFQIWSGCRFGKSRDRLKIVESSRRAPDLHNRICPIIVRSMNTSSPLFSWSVVTCQECLVVSHYMSIRCPSRLTDTSSTRSLNGSLKHKAVPLEGSAVAIRLQLHPTNR